MTDSILRLPVVIRRCGLCRSAIYLAVQRGEFPRQVKLGPRSVGWLESDVDAWISARPRKHVLMAVQS